MSLLLGWGGIKIKIPQQEFALKGRGGLCARGGIFVGHYGTHLSVCMLARVSNSLLHKWLSTTLPNSSQIQRTVLSA